MNSVNRSQLEHEPADEWGIGFVFSSSTLGVAYKTSDEINRTIKRDDIKYVVLDKYSNMIKAGKLISPHYALVKKYGNFEI